MRESEQAVLELWVGLADPGEHLLAQPDPLGVEIEVGRIVDVGQIERLAQRGRRRPAQRQQGAKIGRLPDPHRGQAIEPRAAKHVHQHGLGLIGRGVGQDDRLGSFGLGLLGEGRASSRSGPGRQTRARFEFDPCAAIRQSQHLGDLGHVLGLDRRLRPQAMVDVANTQREPLTASEDEEQPERGDRVPTARDGDEQAISEAPAARELQGPANRAESRRDPRIPGRRVRIEHGATLAAALPCPRVDFRLPFPAVSSPDLRADERAELANELGQQIVEDPLSLELRDDAEALVPALPVQSFVTVARKLQAENRLDLVLPFASAEQITGIFDLDAWERERLVVPRAREWLTRIVESYNEASVERGRLVELMHDTDPEMWILACSGLTAVAELDEPDDDEHRQRVIEDMKALRTWDTPDGHFVVGVPDNALGHMALQILVAVYDDNLVEGRKLISAIKWSLHAEIEEELLRWRKGRLADLGFPEWEDAMRLFAPLVREAIVTAGQSDDAEEGEVEPDTSHVPTTSSALPPAAMGLPHDLIRRVMRSLDDEAYDVHLREFLLLANELMAAQRFEPGDEKLQARAVDQAQATLNLACELLLTSAAQRPEDPEAYLAGRVRAAGLRRLFRYGYGPLAKLRKAALELHRNGHVSLASVGSLLDRPWGPALASLSRWYPELPMSGKAQSRPLRNLADLARATSLVGEAGALAQLCFAAEGLAIEPVWINRVDEPERLHLGDLVRTALICRALPGESEVSLRPLGPDDVEWAAANLLDAEGRLVSALDSALADPLAALGLDERGPALAEILLPRLGVELAGLERDIEGRPDLTKIGGLLTIQQVSVWLST